MSPPPTNRFLPCRHIRSGSSPAALYWTTRGSSLDTILRVRSLCLGRLVALSLWGVVVGVLRIIHPFINNFAKSFMFICITNNILFSFPIWSNEHFHHTQCIGKRILMVYCYIEHIQISTVHFTIRNTIHTHSFTHHTRLQPCSNHFATNTNSFSHSCHIHTAKWHRFQIPWMPYVGGDCRTVTAKLGDLCPLRLLRLGQPQ